MIYIDRSGMIIPALLAAALHDAGHLFALWIYDCPPLRIELVPAAVRIIRRGVSARENVTVTALSGPAVNLAFAFCAGLNYMLYRKSFTLYFTAVNAALGLFNLLPARGLDGGTVLYHIIEKRFSPYAAEAATKSVSLILAAAALVGGVYLYTKGRLNLSVFTAALYLIFCALCAGRER